MTLIGAKHFEKWNLYTDDGITIGKQTISAHRYYRKKIKFLDRTSSPILVCAAGTCDEIDYVINKIDKAICTKNLDMGYVLYDTITEVLPEAFKELKEINGDDAGDYVFFILDVERDELIRVSNFQALIIDKDVEVVEGSGTTAFYEMENRPFLDRFITAVEADEYCRLPLYQWDGEDLGVVTISYDKPVISEEEPDLRTKNEG